MARSNLGGYLAARRRELRLSRAEVAARANANVSTVARVEGGAPFPSAWLLSRLCSALRLSPEQSCEALARAGEGRGPQR